MSKTKEDFLKDVNFSVPMDVFKKELMKKPNGEKVINKLIKFYQGVLTITRKTFPYIT